MSWRYQHADGYIRSSGTALAFQIWCASVNPRIGVCTEGVTPRSSPLFTLLYAERETRRYILRRKVVKSSISGIWHVLVVGSGSVEIWRVICRRVQLLLWIIHLFVQMFLWLISFGYCFNYNANSRWLNGYCMNIEEVLQFKRIWGFYELNCR